MSSRSSSAAAASPTKRGRSFFGERRGSLLTWAALMMVPLLGFVGIATDSARGYLARARLAQALDAAALAAGRNTADAATAEAQAKMIFAANFPPGYLDAKLKGPDFSFNELQDTVAVVASAELPTYFMHLLGIDVFNVSASTEVTRKTVFMDVVISVDVSGSMNEWAGGQTRIAAASDAARILVDALFGEVQSKEPLRMGLVMWSANVKILPVTGTGANYNPLQTQAKNVSTFKNPYTNQNQSTLYYAFGSPVPLLESPPADWTGCTHARFINDGANNDADLEVGTPTVGGKRWRAWQPATVTQTGTNSSGQPIYSSMQCPNHGIQRLTRNRGEMISAIQMIKDPTGNTNMVSGLMWAWRVLGVPGSGSPFDGDGSKDPDKGEGELIRAIVLMTDGANTQSKTDAYQGALTPSQLDSRSLSAAQKIKAAGIVIYTIRFGNEASESLLKQVASGPTAPYYQYAPDAAALKAAFQEIGNHLSKLRISK
jgi:hypothetical protein